MLTFIFLSTVRFKFYLFFVRNSLFSYFSWRIDGFYIIFDWFLFIFIHFISIFCRKNIRTVCIHSDILNDFVGHFSFWYEWRFHGSGASVEGEMVVFSLSISCFEIFEENQTFSSFQQAPGTWHLLIFILIRLEWKNSNISTAFLFISFFFECWWLIEVMIKRLDLDMINIFITCKKISLVLWTLGVEEFALLKKNQTLIVTKKKNKIKSTKHKKREMNVKNFKQ